MRLYETTFILGPQADEATFDRQVKAISDLIERNQGKIVKEHRVGIRRLAYPIQKYTQGYYTRIIFEGNNSLLTELERFYKLEEPYIRFLTVIFEGDPEVDYERQFGHFRGGRGDRGPHGSDRRDRHRDQRPPRDHDRKRVEEKPAEAVKETPAATVAAPESDAAPKSEPAVEPEKEHKSDEPKTDE